MEEDFCPTKLSDIGELSEILCKVEGYYQTQFNKLNGMFSTYHFLQELNVFTLTFHYRIISFYMGQ